MTYSITNDDARALSLPDASVDLVVTSPPYFGLRSYTDNGEHYEQQIGAEATPAEFVEALIASTREMVRVLKPSGSIWVNLGDKYNKQKSLGGLPWRYVLRCIDDLGLILRAEVIWSKPNGLPESVTDRVRRSHETWFHFTAQPRYFASLDHIREPHTWTRKIDPKWARAREETAMQRGGGHRNGVSGGFTNPQNPLGKLPGSVKTVAVGALRVPPELAVQHFAAFPPEWPRWIISGWCPEGGTVLDPFGGTGTTAMAADVLGRHGISNDLSADYNRVAEWRINDPKQRAKVKA